MTIEEFFKELHEHNIRFVETDRKVCGFVRVKDSCDCPIVALARAKGLITNNDCGPQNMKWSEHAHKLGLDYFDAYFIVRNADGQQNDLFDLFQPLIDRV